jgi:hypothetical protein
LGNLPSHVRCVKVWHRGRGQERNDAGKRRHGDAARKAKDRGQRTAKRRWRLEERFA